MSSSLSLTMSVSDPQNRRLFCGTCRRWGAGGWRRVTLRLEHAKVSCPGSPGTGRDPAFSGKGSTAGLTLATSHHLPPGITLPTNFSCRAATGPEKPIGAGCVPGARAVAGTRGGRPRGALTWQLLGGARATALREAVAGGAGLRAVLFPPPEGVSRSTPTSRLCTLHHNRADVTIEAVPSPTQNPGPAAGAWLLPQPRVLGAPRGDLWRKSLHLGLRGRVKRFLVCHLGKRRPNCEVRLEMNLGPLGKRARVLKFSGTDGTMLRGLTCPPE